MKPMTLKPVSLAENADGEWDLAFEDASADDVVTASLTLTFSDPESAQADYFLGEPYVFSLLPPSSPALTTSSAAAPAESGSGL